MPLYYVAYYWGSTVNGALVDCNRGAPSYPIQMGYGTYLGAPSYSNCVGTSPSSGNGGGGGGGPHPVPDRSLVP